MYELLQAISTYARRVLTYDPLVVAVQLLLIGFVVWLVMRFLRGTRGARLLKGAALLLALVYVGIRLLPKNDDWKRVEFLYGHFLVFVFVAVVVAFQPELRRALIQIGQARLFHGAHGRVEAVVEALSDSAAYLSRNKIGAVIAVERSVGLGGIIETGTPINAVLTSGLLNTIFYPGSALHDMGVVVREGRIAAAGCQFPLAESGDVDPSLGSRHRAALGLAQDCDALVLVVSEQTGRVSVACEGQLYLGLQPDHLREMLLGLLAPKHILKRRQRRPGEAARKPQ
jgi:diadenylate cyclase